MRRERVVKYTNTNTKTNLTQPNECEVEKTHKLSNFFEVMEKTAEIKKVTKIVIPARDLFMDKGIKFKAHLFSKIESFRNQRKIIYETKFLVRETPNKGKAAPEAAFPEVSVWRPQPGSTKNQLAQSTMAAPAISVR